MLPKSATHARIQTRTYDFKEAKRPMEYELYVPTKNNASRPAPLMVTLHGLSVQPRDQIRFGYLTELADKCFLLSIGFTHFLQLGRAGLPRLLQFAQ
jgi:poly(3-hydroxybutyrate) depolymerase